MTHATIYPPADRASQWRGDAGRYGGVDMASVNKVVLHTTESAGWPAYPTFQPTFTLDMVTGKVRQHLPANRSASTLANAGTVKTNRLCVQIELVGYCDPARASSAYYLTHWTDAGYRSLADLLVWLRDEWGIPLTSSVSWQPYPASYGARAKQRLSAAEFSAYRGILGHQHVPGNDHGDPGRIDIDRLLALTGTQPAPYPPPTSGVVYLDRLAAGVKQSDSVAYVQEALAKLGLRDTPPTGEYGKPTQAAVEAWRDSPACWRALFAAAGMTDITIEEHS